VLAPTGTIGFMMDCDTTGIEPDFSLVKFKKLVGGGTMNIVNQTVPRALKALGYSKDQVDSIVNYIDTEKTIVGAPGLKPEHLNVFACSMGDNSIHYLGHVKMMAATQPFLSGAISKTVNMPEDASVEDIEQIHIDSWKMGLKAVAIYRDNCKVAQPLSMMKKGGDANNNTTEGAGSGEAAPAAAAESVTDKFIVKGAVRRRLPRIRNSKTYKFQIADLEGYFTVGEYEDGTPGELFLSVSKQGSTLAGLLDSFAISVSHGLQYGVPLKSYVKTLRGTSFAPSGITDDPDIRTASSITDYIVRRLALDYLSFDDRLELGLASFDDMPTEEQVSLLGDSNSETEQAADSEHGANHNVSAPSQGGTNGSAASPAIDPTKGDTADRGAGTDALSNTQTGAGTKPAQTALAAKLPAAAARVASPAVNTAPALSSADAKLNSGDSTAPLCYNCGNQTQRAGSCYVCSSCGSTTGCS
jgi:ribonucleoside-diphosphate reductase alpha chain